MLIYLAARYGRHPELHQYAQRLEAAGHVVVSRWIQGQHQALDATLVQPEARSDAQQFALEDVTDLCRATCFIGFSEALRAPSRGGRHVELGMALALRKRIIVVGGHEHVFHCLPQVEHYATFDEACAALNTEETHEYL